MYRPGDRVMTPNGPGRVIYIRMAPPDYREVAAVSVRVEATAGRAGYTGTIYPASSVRLLEPIASV